MQEEETLPMTAQQYDYKIETFTDQGYQLGIYLNNQPFITALQRAVSTSEDAGELIIGTWVMDDLAGQPGSKVIFHPDNKVEMITPDAHRSGFWKKSGTFNGRIMIVARKNFPR